MDRLYKKFTPGNSTFLYVVSILLICSFILLSFRSPILALPAVRDAQVKRFISQTVRSQELDVQKLWRLRDRLGATVVFNPEYFEPYSVIRLKNTPTAKVWLLQYSAPGLDSTEYLVPVSIATQSAQMVGDRLFKDTDSEIVHNTSTHTIQIRTVKSYAEMKKNNGMIIYPRDDSDLASLQWIVETTIIMSPDFSPS